MGRHLQLAALAALVASAGACGGSAPVAAPGVVLDPATLAVLATLAPAELPPPPRDISNRFADDTGAAALGQKLFFDSGFSGPLIDPDNSRADPTTLGDPGDTGRVACAGCHLPDGDFSDTRTRGGQISLAAGWGKRRAPSLLDVGQARLVMWDGRHDALYNQVFGPIESSVEMNSSRLFVAEELARRYRNQYEAVFGALPDFGDATRFPQLSPDRAGCELRPADAQHPCHGRPGDQAEFDALAPADQDAVTRAVVNFGKAIAAYERKLSCGPSRFDAWMHGDAEALDAAEQRGALLFAGKGQCVRCHDGPFLSDQKFHDVGLTPGIGAVVFVDSDDRGARTGVAAALGDPLDVRGRYSDGDDGRLPAAIDPALEGAFRTPTLRCVSERPSLFHTGQIRSLEAAVHFLSSAPPDSGPGHSELTPLDLSADEEADLVAFLRALVGPGPADDLRHR